MKVAVYGTLKAGYGADLAEWHPDNKKLQNAVLVGWDMFSNGGYPMCIPGEGSIHIEVWDVSEDILPELDRYEGHPHLFKRVTVEVPEVGPVFMYEFAETPTWCKKIEGGLF